MKCRIRLSRVGSVAGSALGPRSPPPTRVSVAGTVKVTPISCCAGAFPAIDGAPMFLVLSRFDASRVYRYDESEPTKRSAEMKL